MQVRFVLCGVLPAALVACSDDAPFSTSSSESVEESAIVPVSITLGGTYDMGMHGTRSAPPGASTDPYDPQVDGEAEAEGTDRVRILAFRRKDTADDVLNEADAEVTDEADTINEKEFIYDPTNDHTVTCSRENAADHRLKAHSKLKKVRGYEYRVIALAYSSVRTFSSTGGLMANLTGEDNLFSLNLQPGTSLADVQADISQTNMENWKEYLNGTDVVTRNTHCLSGYLSYAPQLFYGQCQTQMGNRVIHFRERQKNDSIISTSPLTGVLYRGMARVEVTLTVDKQEKGKVHWVALMANQTNTSVRLNDYDAFLRPFNPIAETMGNKNTHDTYTVLDVVEGNSEIAEGSTVTLKAWVLPTATHLAVRVFCKNGGLVRYPHNYLISTTDVSSAEQGTGIISPDVAGDVFYFRRNHRYRFSGVLSTLTKKSELPN